MKFVVWLTLFLAGMGAGAALVEQGTISLAEADVQPGKRIDLTGQWLYRPGYETDTNRFLPLQVPQFLNRIYWWLDDSADFTRWEDERLKKLGFDTDKAEDGWYQLNLDLPKIPAGRHFFLDFDGVAMRCKVFCNGQLLGAHEGMFSRFGFDVTSVLHAGSNRIDIYDSMEKIALSSNGMTEAVTVNLTGSKVKTMSKGMYGPMWPMANPHAYDLHGIWQPVRLQVTGDARVEDAWFIPSTNGGGLKVTGRLFGSRPVTIRAVWEGLAELRSQKIQWKTANFSTTLRLRDVKPKLWTPATPNLYPLRVTIEAEDGTMLDQWSAKVGFRTFEIHGNEFYLNGHPWWLRGANHLPYGKNPWDPELPRQLIQRMHDNNVRITRTHCTPWNEAWLDAADEIGLGVSLEGIRPWALAGLIGVTPPDLFQQWLTENKDVIERCRNHPSVLIYTVGNEMLLRDQKNLDKWKQLSAVVQQTRKADPTRPVICSSEYARDPDYYRTVLKPNGIDDGDIDDMHRYNNWYGPSSFVTDSKFENEAKRNGGTRPLMGQEMSTGYPDLDDGLPVWRYTHDLLTPQAWVGIDSYPASDPAVFLEHHRAVTKRWAEQLRFQRSTNTAGFMLFAVECWFSHSYDPRTLKPYPVLDAVRQAYEPVGLAWETGRRRFYGGDAVNTAVFISNDDEQYRDFHQLELEAEFSPGRSQSLGEVSDLPYGKTVRIPVQLSVPPADRAREKATVILRLKNGGDVISETTDPVEIFKKDVPATNNAGVIVLRSVKSLDAVRDKISNGATAILFSPGKEIVKTFPEAFVESKKMTGEYADFFPIAGTPLARGLEKMDLKWWARRDDWRTFVASEAQRLRPNGAARELIRYIPPHGYITPEKLPDQYWAVLSEIRLGQGRLWVCDLDLDRCVGIDPAADLFARNLFQAAADPASTSHLPPTPTHEELMKSRPNPARH